MDKCKNIECQALQSEFNKLYKVFESNRKSHEEFGMFLSKLANGESLDKVEVIRMFKSFVSLKEAAVLASKFLVK